MPSMARVHYLDDRHMIDRCCITCIYREIHKNMEGDEVDLVCYKCLQADSIINRLPHWRPDKPLIERYIDDIHEEMKLVEKYKASQ